MNIYKVINWDTDQVMSEHETLKQASRACKKLGHTGQTNEISVGMFPVAFVGIFIDGKYCGCVYNPRFKKEA